MNNIIKKIKPDKKVKKITNKFLKELNDLLKGDAIAIIGGSIGKDTYLKNYDCDIFIKFPNDNNISEKLFKKIKHLNPTTIRGSRNYYQVKKYGIEFELIPILNITKPEDAKNITDISPLHLTWINKFDYKDEIRLTKYFCKMNNIYGAESYINGFSGYVLEILTIYYKGFDNLIKAVSKWKKQTILDPNNYYKNKEEILSKMNKSKISSPLIIIDPVQKERNAASSLNEQNYNKLIYLAKTFNKSYFKKIPFNIEKIKQKSKENNTKLIALKYQELPGNKDIARTKIKKIFEHIIKQLKINEFNIITKNINYNESIFYFEIYPTKLPEITKQIGPTIYANKEHLYSFKKKHFEIFIENDKLVTLTKRSYTKPKSLIVKILTEDYIKNRVKKIKFL